jgi:hypothetical protein
MASTTGGSSTATILVVVGVVILAGLAIGLLTAGHTFLALLAACGAVALVAAFAALRS